MTHGSIIGYDINAKMCQISYYNEKTQEPETVDTGIEKENNQIPLVMNYYKAVSYTHLDCIRDRLWIRQEHL